MSRVAIAVPLLLIVLTACGGGKEETPPVSSGPPALTAFQQENGIGPITEAIAAGPIDRAMAERGEKTFEASCSGCHKLDERYVGPPLRDVTVRRTPTYVMNMILGPDTMYTRHPVARGLLAQYATQMPNLHLSQTQAREIVEYLRHEAQDKH
ncbi:MAG TPA: cytochrome c [Gemmatimonadales bacterium]|nr:cytochrome c [Gemmatimonadales bacterium]